jgi:hypothetical protein
VTVPTVDRGFFDVVFCSIEMAGRASSVDVKLSSLRTVARTPTGTPPILPLGESVETRTTPDPSPREDTRRSQNQRDVLRVVLAGAAIRSNP